MEAKIKKEVLSTLVKLVDRNEEFGLNDLNMIIQETYPEYKLNSILSHDLKECFGSSVLLCRREPSPSGHGSIMRFKFTTASKEELNEKINNYVKIKENRLDKIIAKKIYDYLEFLPGIDSDYKKTYNQSSIPDLELINKYCSIFTDLTISFNIEKYGRFNIKKLNIKLPREEFLKKYRIGFEKIFGSGLLSDTKESREDDEETKIVREFPKIFEKLNKDFETERDYKIAVCILNLMKKNRKECVIIDDIFDSLKKNNIDCTGLNLLKWCNSGNKHFHYVNNKVHLRPESCCENMFTKKPILSKKVEKKEVKIENLDSFYFLTETKLSNTDYLKFEKQVYGLYSYRCYIDFNNPESVLEALNIVTIHQNNVFGEEAAIKKLYSTVFNAIKTYVEM